MGCNISNSGSSSGLPASENKATITLPGISIHEEKQAMPQSTEEQTAQGAVEALEAELRRFSISETAPQVAATVSDEVQEEDSSSSSSDSSDGLPCELHASDGTRTGPHTTQPPAAPVPGDALVGLLYDQLMEQHFGPDHYERPARIIQLHATLQEQQLMARCWQLVPRKATDDELLLAHSEEHISKVDSMYEELFPGRPDDLADAAYCYADGRMQDVYLSAGTATAARYAAGCCVEAVQSVLSGAVQRALAVVRPPGHHAECERAMGFCFFNNVAVAALMALQHPGIRRVAVLDWDVHHGNGIQNLLLQRPDALYISLHRDPKRFYPYHSGFVNEAGEGAGTGFNVNVPWLKKGMADGDYMAAFSLVVEPILECYQPDLVIVAAGFDAADGDPLGGCKLTPEGYAWMTERLMRFAGGRLVLALEGGYNTRVTSWCAAACLRTLLEGRASPPLPADKEHLWPSEAHNSLKLVYEFQRQYWPVLRARSWTDAWEGNLKEVHRALGSNVRSKRGSGGGAPEAGSSGSSNDAAAGRSNVSDASTSGVAPGRAPSGRRASAAGAARRGNSGGGAPLPPAPAPTPPSLQEAFRARKTAKEAAAAAPAAEELAYPAYAAAQATGNGDVLTSETDIASLTATMLAIVGSVGPPCSPAPSVGAAAVAAAGFLTAPPAVAVQGSAGETEFVAVQAVGSYGSRGNSRGSGSGGGATPADDGCVASRTRYRRASNGGINGDGVCIVASPLAESGCGLAAASLTPPVSRGNGSAGGSSNGCGSARRSQGGA